MNKKLQNLEKSFRSKPNKQRKNQKSETTSAASSSSDNIRKKRGNSGEEHIAQWLVERSYTILDRNYYTRVGEIDVIATKGNVIAFVEVKLRTHYYFDPSQLITPSKQRKIIHTAHHYIARYFQGVDRIYRFDVALVELVDNKYNVTYIENAFTKS